MLDYQEDTSSTSPSDSFDMPSVDAGPVAPQVTLASAPSASATNPATLGEAVPGNGGDTLTVQLLSDTKFKSGSSLTLANGALIYTPGVITASNAGADELTYLVTDTTNGLVTEETQNVGLVAPPAAPKLRIIKSTTASDASPTVLGTAIPGNSGDTLIVQILSDNKFHGSSSVTLVDGVLFYTPGTITASNAGIDRISYLVTDTTNGLVTKGMQNVNLVVKPVAPAVTLAASPNASASNPATLGTAVAGNSGDKLTVQLLSDTDFSSGSSLTLANGALMYTPGAITTSNAGMDQLTYAVTDTTNGLVTDETQAVGLVATIGAPAITPNVVTATVSTGSGLTTQQVDLSTPTTGTFVATSASGVGANPLVLFNWDPATQLSSFIAAVAAGAASIVAEGDSTTLGFGTASAGFRDLSYASEMSQALTQDGVSAQFSNFLGLGNENGATVDNRIALIGTATGNFPFDAGGQIIQTNNTGDGFNFTLNSPGDYDRLTVSYLDAGTGSDTVSVMSAEGATLSLGTIQFTNTGETLTTTFDMTPGEYQEMMLRQVGSTSTDIQGVSFSSTTSPAIQVEDAGIGGETAVGANQSSVFYDMYTASTRGAGPTAGVAALSPSLAIVDFGINDIDNSSYDGESLSSIITSYEQIVTTLKNSGSDVIIMLPEAWLSPAIPGTSETYYQQDFPTLLSQIENFAISQNVGVINLSATYGDNYQTLVSAGLLGSDNLHPDATLDADIGAQLASLLTSAIDNASNTTGYSAKSVSANDATISGAATVNTLIGAGTNDTYVMNATDQSDTIINGSSATAGPTNILDINAANHDQLWFKQSGKNLVIDVLGTNQEIVVQNWFGSSSAQLQTIAGNDSYTLTTANVQNLVQAMATFSGANAGFNPAAAVNTSLANAAYGETLTLAVVNAWHHS
jgi:hypothetical protein